MPTLTNVVQIVVQGNVTETGGGGKSVWSVWNYRLLSGVTTDTAVAVANNFLTNVWATVAAALSSSWVGSTTLARFLDDATAAFLSANVPASGAVTGARLPTQASVAYLLRGAQRGKSFRGGKRLGVIAQTHVTGDELNATGLTAWNPVTTVIGNNLTMASGALYKPVVFSRSLSQIHTNPTLLVGSDVASVLLDKTIGTMRRRREKTVR